VPSRGRDVHGRIVIEFDAHNIHNGSVRRRTSSTPRGARMKQAAIRCSPTAGAGRDYVPRLLCAHHQT
jgi:hypothetical protein